MALLLSTTCMYVCVYEHMCVYVHFLFTTYWTFSLAFHRNAKQKVYDNISMAGNRAV